MMMWVRGNRLKLIWILGLLVSTPSHGFFFGLFKTKPSFSINENVKALKTDYLKSKGKGSLKKIIRFSRKKNKQLSCSQEALKESNTLESKGYFKAFYIVFGVKCTVRLNFNEKKNHEVIHGWIERLKQIYVRKAWSVFSEHEQELIHRYSGKFYKKLFLNLKSLSLEDQEVESIVLHMPDIKNINTILRISNFWIERGNKEMAQNVLKVADLKTRHLKVLERLKSLSDDPKSFNEKIKEFKIQQREYRTFKKLYGRRRYKSFLKHLVWVQEKDPKITETKKLQKISRQIGWIFYRSKDSFRREIIGKVGGLKLDFNEFFWTLSNQGLFDGIKKVYKNLSEEEQEKNLSMALKAYLYSGDYIEGLKLAKTKRVETKISNPENLFFSGLIALRANELKWADKAFEKLVDADTDYKLESMYLRYRIENGKNNKFKHAKKIVQSYPLTFYGLLVAHEEKLTLELPFLEPSPDFKVPFDLSDLKERKWLHQIVFIVDNKLFGEFREFVNAGSEFLGFGSQVVLAAYFKEKNFPLAAIKIMNRVWTVHKNWITPSLIPIAFPKDYWNTINRYAASGVDPYLVLAIIRQESAFQRRAQSPARARGLMQLLLPTARQVARSLRMKRVSLPWDLFRPRINVKLGSSYLKKRIRAYEGHVPLALVSYNAGPGRLQKWSKPREIITTSQDTLESTNWKDQDLWVEELPWDETRFYVKAVLRNYLLYHLFERFEPMKACFRRWNCSDSVLAGHGEAL